MPLRLSANNQKVVPVIPYHVIGCPFLSANSDSSVSFSLNDARSNAENLSDILASQAIKRMQLTFPNLCSYKGCGAPLQLVPEHCSSCLRLVHLICHQFVVGLSKADCYLVNKVYTIVWQCRVWRKERVKRRRRCRRRRCRCVP